MFTTIDEAVFESYGGTDHDIGDDGEGEQFAVDDLTVIVPYPSLVPVEDDLIMY